MVAIDLFINLLLFMIPVIVAFIFASGKRKDVLVYAVIWLFVSAYASYSALNFVNDYIMLVPYLILIYFIVIWGVKYLVNLSVEERTRIITSIPKSFVIKAIKEASMELNCDWICEFKLKNIVKTKQVNLEIGLLRIKNRFGVYFKCKPGEKFIIETILVTIGFLIINTWILLYVNEPLLIIINLPIYLPVLSFLLGVYILYILFHSRKIILKQLSMALLLTRNKIKAAEKLYNTLKIINMAEKVKKKMAMQKIKEAIKLAKGIELAEKLKKKS